jgi:hypothetical protein
MIGKPTESGCIGTERDAHGEWQKCERAPKFLVTLQGNNGSWWLCAEHWDKVMAMPKAERMNFLDSMLAGFASVEFRDGEAG